MPTKKPDTETKTPEPDTAKAVVSKLGVNDEPKTTEPKVVETKNGRTMTYN
tara:strand:- start:238 stop:390 length:153 start_codon:yes stop_codon:yes gene_type:complete